MTILTTRQQKIVREISERTDLTSWGNWRWQVRNTVRDMDSAERLLGISFSDKEKQAFRRTTKKFPVSITPYYLSLIDTDDIEHCPVFRQAFPSVHELTIGPHDMRDPLAEELDSPVPGITHRYPDRVLFHVSNLCAMYCRHCTRKRKVGDRDSIPGRKQIEQGIRYIADNSSVRDVLMSGGDPLMLSDDYLDWILTELGKIPHVEIVRIGTRTPVVLPFRITDELVQMFSRHHPLWINTHFNHPNEVTTAAQLALAKLADGGIPLGNQSVLLAGVNDCPSIMKELVHRLVRSRVRPYYIYQCDLSEGLTHFRTPITKGIEIIENLIGHTSGLAVPTYVIDAPGGGGKIPITPNYIVSSSANKVVLRNYEGVIYTYEEPSSYEPHSCERGCAQCDLTLNGGGVDEGGGVYIERFLDDHDEKIALVSEEAERVVRR